VSELVEFSIPPRNMHLADDRRATCTDIVLGQAMAKRVTRGLDLNVPGNLVRVPGFKFPGY